MYPWVLDNAGKVVLKLLDDLANVSDVQVVLVKLIKREGQKLIPNINR